MSNALTDALGSFLDAITNTLTGTSTSLDIMTTGFSGNGIDFMQGSPYTELNIATTDRELAILQGLTGNQFLDVRNDTRVMWTRVSGNWSSVGYGGNLAILRPGTLCYSPATRRAFMCDKFLRLNDIAS